MHDTNLGSRLKNGRVNPVNKEVDYDTEDGLFCVHTFALPKIVISMKHISIVVPEGHASLVNIEGTYQILTDVNAMLSEKGRAPLFHVQLVGISEKATQRKGLFTIAPDA